MTTVVLCGSTRFEQQFKEANYELSRRGYVVLSLSSGPSDREGELDPVDKIVFDLTYFEKIRMADCVLVLDQAGFGELGQPYIGFSTAREIVWASMQDRPLLYLSDMTHWSLVCDAIERRFEEAHQHRGLSQAQEVLRKHEGQAVVADLVEDTAKSVMHATLSVMACQTGVGATMAEATLLSVGLDPMDGDDLKQTLIVGGVAVPTDFMLAGTHAFGGEAANQTDSNLVRYAKHELAIINKDGDEMQNMMDRHLIRMVTEFSREGHSGFSASYAVGALKQLLMFRPLSPLTGEADEWIVVDDKGLKQNKRCGTVFMESDGQAYDIEGRVFTEPSGDSFTGRDSRVNISFPYVPTREEVQVEAERNEDGSVRPISDKTPPRDHAMVNFNALRDRLNRHITEIAYRERKRKLIVKDMEQLSIDMDSAISQL